MGKGRISQHGNGVLLPTVHLRYLDALSDGEDDNEIFARIDVTFPMKRLGKDLLRFDRGTYPVDIKGQMDQRVVRERFITYEKKRN